MAPNRIDLVVNMTHMETFCCPTGVLLVFNGIHGVEAAGKHHSDRSESTPSVHNSVVCWKNNDLPLVQKMLKFSLPTFCKNCYISHLKSVVPLIEQWVETLKLLGNQIIEPNGTKYNWFSCEHDTYRNFLLPHRRVAGILWHPWCWSNGEAP